MTSTLPGWIRYDADSDTLVIYGQRYSAQAFAHLGFGPIGRVFRIVKRDGSLTIENLAEAPTPPVAEPRDHRKELWVDTCAAVSGALDCKNALTGPNWADVALARFDKAFPS